MFLKVVTLEMLLSCIITLQLAFVSAQLLHNPNPQTQTSNGPPAPHPGVTHSAGRRSINFDSSSWNSNGFSSNYQPVSTNTGNQQFVSNSFTVPASGNSFIDSSASSPTVAASSNFNSGVQNAFTAASLTIPSIQRFLTSSFPGFKAADLIFKVSNQRWTELGHPYHDAIANLVAQNFAGIDSFSIPLYFQIRGNVIEKFLLAEGIEITPDLPQRYAAAIEQELSAITIDNPQKLHRAILDGYSSFLQSVHNTSDKSYIIPLYINNEIALFRNI